MSDAAVADAAPAAAPDAAAAPAPDAPAALPSDSPAPAAPADWKTGLPEDLQAEPALADYKGEVGDVLPKLAKSLVHAQKLVGMDRNSFAVVPAADAGDEAWAEFYNKIGRPETADAYTLPVDKIEFDDKLERNEEMEGWYKETAHKHGLTAQQAAGLYQEFMGYMKGALGATDVSLAKMNDQGTQALKQEWGAAYDRKMERAVNVLRNYASDGLLDLLDSTGLGSHPEMAKMLAGIAEASGEDTLTDKSKTAPVMTPAEANAEIAQKHNDADFMKAYTTKGHPSHDWAVQEMSRLHRFATAGAT